MDIRHKLAGCALAVLLAFNIQYTQAAPVITKGLTAYWSFDGDAEDKSGNGHHAVGNGAILTTGKFGQAYQFDGASAIFIPSFDFASTNGEFTVTGWISTSHQPQRNFQLCWIQKMDFYGGPFSIYAGDQPDSGMGIQTWYDSGFTTNNSAAVTVYGSTKNNLYDGNWHFCAAVVTPFKRSIFIDGVKVGSSNLPTLIQNNTSDIFIGGYVFGWQQRPWIGNIDEVAMYNRALSDNEVNALYKGQISPSISFTPGPGSTLLSNQKFDFLIKVDSIPSPIVSKKFWFDGLDQSASFFTNIVTGAVPNGTCFLKKGVLWPVGSHAVKVSFGFQNGGTATKTMNVNVIKTN